jgi:isopentenyl-diphosphate delta-isomerase
MTNYYKQKQFIARVDRMGDIIGKIEKWEAHEKGVLHKGLSIALIYKGRYILQHRKHPAFDGVYDLTTSSHPLFVNNKLETSEDSSLKALKREWESMNLEGKIKNLGAVYYKTKDPKSIYIEHEVCDILTLRVNEIPQPNYNFAYGFSLVTKEELLNKKSRVWELLSPWTKAAIEEGLL